MKMLITYSTLLLLFMFCLVVGCQSPKEERKVEETVEDLMEYEVPADNKPLEFQRKKELGQKDTISFEIQKPSFVRMKLLLPSDSGNIRINQLVMPDGEMDGPFGKTYEAYFDQLGTYQIIIAESMMAENPYTGDYALRIEME
ncbi:hypothetical protein [Sphingobacterium arenae]|uniref:YtkA-like domain-containing protein n=1 Tax=Sphingobacterium arenae TaxID=1280598 RepID=A0ABR7Y7N9_9SPHI|nr:hypothetical protein [Sphingobacterium arenae]MBD1427325.1 hypothetical protein [Sphingobacterium arenae]